MDIKFGANEVNAVHETAVESIMTATDAGGKTVTETQVHNPVADSQQALVPAQSTGLVLGDKLPSFGDIILPRLNIVQNIGALKDTFLPGTVVLNQTTVLFVPAAVDGKTGNVVRAATPPATLVVLGFRPTRYVEKLNEAQRASGQRGALVASETAVRESGGTLDYNEWQLKKASGMKRFEPLADAVVIVERPDAAADDDTVFTFNVAGRKYALAIWGLHGTSYTAAAKRVFFTDRAIGCLKAGYPTRSYSLSTRLEKYSGGNQAWVPVCVAKEKTSAEFLAFVADILGATSAPEPAASAV